MKFPSIKKKKKKTLVNLRLCIFVSHTYIHEAGKNSRMALFIVGLEADRGNHHGDGGRSHTRDDRGRNLRLMEEEQ